MLMEYEFFSFLCQVFTKKKKKSYNIYNAKSQRFEKNVF